MKRFGQLVAVLVLGALAASSAMAADGDGAGRDGAKGRRGKPGKHMRGRPGPPARVWKQLDLTDEQQAAIKELHQASRAKMKEAEGPEARKAIMDALRGDVRKVLTEEQAKKLDALHQKMGPPPGPRGPKLTDAQKKILADAREAAKKAETPAEKRKIMRDAMDKVRASFTDEQKKQAAAMRQRQRRRGMMAGLDLTDAQKKILADAREAAQKAETPAEKRKIMKEAMDKVRASLTDEQKKKAAAMRQRQRGRGMLAGLDLTDAQKKILADAREAAKKAETPAEKRKIMKEAMDKVRASLTDEQKKKAAAMRRRHGNRRGGRDGRGRRGALQGGADAEE